MSISFPFHLGAQTTGMRIGLLVCVAIVYSEVCFFSREAGVMAFKWESRVLALLNRFLAPLRRLTRLRVYHAEVFSRPRYVFAPSLFFFSPESFPGRDIIVSALRVVDGSPSFISPTR